jgi:hypothetical protein
MKPIVIVKQYLEPKCKYSGMMGRLFTCTHEEVKHAPLNGQAPDEPCTIADWKVCPLNRRIK